MSDKPSGESLSERMEREHCGPYHDLPLIRECSACALAGTPHHHVLDSQGLLTASARCLAPDIAKVISLAEQEVAGLREQLNERKQLAMTERIGDKDLYSRVDTFLKKHDSTCNHCDKDLTGFRGHFTQIISEFIAGMDHDAVEQAEAALAAYRKVKALPSSYVRDLRAFRAVIELHLSPRPEDSYAEGVVDAYRACAHQIDKFITELSNPELHDEWQTPMGEPDG